jgi:hypothetical protein
MVKSLDFLIINFQTLKNMTVDKVPLNGKKIPQIFKKFQREQQLFYGMSIELIRFLITSKRNREVIENLSCKNRVCVSSVFRPAFSLSPLLQIII